MISENLNKYIIDDKNISINSKNYISKKLACKDYLNMKVKRNKYGLSKVVFLGKQNVGKSTIFNRMSNRLKSMTHNERGVTRDFISDIASWDGFDFEIVDTAGYMNFMGDTLQTEVLKRLNLEIEDADVLVFIFDGTQDLTCLEIDLLRMLRRSRKPYIIVANKMDKKDIKDATFFLSAYGIFEHVKVSGAHGLGINDLYTKIACKIALTKNKKWADEYANKRLPEIALIGKPNVGKSSLANALWGIEKSIVTDIPGTTREAIKDTIKVSDVEVDIFDCAGVRRQASIETYLEEMMVTNTMEKLKMSDIAIMIIDSSNETIHDQDIKLAGYIFQDLKKPMIVVWNKSDLIDSSKLDKKISDTCKKYPHFFGVVTNIKTSAKKPFHKIGHIKREIGRIWKFKNTELDSNEMLMYLITELEKHPIFRKKERIELRKLELLEVLPLKIFVKFRKNRLIEDSHLNFLEKKLRKKYNLKGIPVKFVLNIEKDYY
jgi:GTPase